MKSAAKSAGRSSETRRSIGPRGMANHKLTEARSLQDINIRPDRGERSKSGHHKPKTQCRLEHSHTRYMKQWRCPLKAATLGRIKAASIYGHSATGSDRTGGACGPLHGNCNSTDPTCVA